MGILTKDKCIDFYKKNIKNTIQKKTEYLHISLLNLIYLKENLIFNHNKYIFDFKLKI